MRAVGRFEIVLPLRSLDNISDEIRWSIDLRYKKTGLPSGVHGLKDDVILRSSKDRNMRIDWSKFKNIDRHKLKLDKTGNRIDVSRYCFIEGYHLKAKLPFRIIDETYHSSKLCLRVPVNRFNHTSWMTVVTPTDRPKSVLNSCVIEVCGGVLVLYFVIGLSQISFFL